MEAVLQALTKGLRKSAILQSVLDGLPIGVVVASPSERVLFVNEEALRVLELIGTEVRGLTIGELTRLASFHYPNGERIPNERRPLLRALKEESVRNEVFIVKAKDGERLVVASAQPIKDGSNKIVAAIAMWQDVSAARALAELAGTAVREEAVKQAAQPGRLQCEIENKAGATILRVTGEIDLANAFEFQAFVARALEMNSGKPIVYDLRLASYLDTRALRILEDAFQHNGDSVVVASPIVERLFKLVGLERYVRS